MRMHAQLLSRVLTLCDPMDGSPPGSSVLGIFQVRMLEWVSIFSSRDSSRPRARSCVSSVLCIASGFFTTAPPGKLQFPLLQEIKKPDFKV